MKLGISNLAGHSVVVGSGSVRDETAEALFELQVDAFMAGVSTLIPEGADYGIGEERAALIINRSVVAAHAA